MTTTHQTKFRRRRACLVVPGSNSKMIGKAVSSGADEVILDLEDAVIPAQKNSARELVLRTIAESDPSRGLAVRINAMNTEWAADDLAALKTAGPALHSVVVPKVESPDELSDASDALGSGPARLQALIETPRSVTRVESICDLGPRLDAVIIGYADLAAALGRAAGLPPEMWIAVQDRVLVGARAHGISVIDGPHLTTADDDVFLHACRWAWQLGFDGKWVIHPGQIETTVREFTPSTDAVNDARQVLDALADASLRGDGAAQLDGRMLDEALAVSARRTLSLSGESAS